MRFMRFFCSVRLGCGFGVRNSMVKVLGFWLVSKTSFFPTALITAQITAFGLITIACLNEPIGHAQESHSKDAFVASVKPNKSGNQGAGFDYSSPTGFSA
jgi:hypothetical protein